MPQNLDKSDQDLVVKDIRMISTVSLGSKQLKNERDKTVEVNKIYEGQKVFWRFDAKVTFLIFEHKTKTKNCIEVISYFTTDDTMVAPRLYLSSKKILENLKKLDTNSGIMSGKQIAMYIFNRIVMVKKPLIEGISFNVSLLSLNEDIQTAEIGNVEASIMVDYDGEPILGPLPNIFTHDGIEESPTDLMIEWGAKLLLFQRESDNFQEQANKAGNCCKATGEAFVKFLDCFKHKTYAEDAINVSIPRRRWCKAIRKQLLRGHVKRITEMLDERERKRLKMLIEKINDSSTGIKEGEAGNLEELSKRLQELSNKSVHLEPLLKPTSENDSNKFGTGDMTPDSPGMFLLPVMKVRLRSKANLVSTHSEEGDGQSPVSRSEMSLPPVGLSRQSSMNSRKSSMNMSAVHTALEPLKTETTSSRSNSIDERGDHRRRRNRRHTHTEIKSSPRVRSPSVESAPSSPLKVALSLSNLNMDGDGGKGVGTEVEHSRNRSMSNSRIGVGSRVSSIVFSAATQAALMAGHKVAPHSNDEATSSPDSPLDPDEDTYSDGVRSNDVSRSNSVNPLLPIVQSVLLPVEEGPVIATAPKKLLRLLPIEERSEKEGVSQREGVVGIPPTSFLPNIKGLFQKGSKAIELVS
mmetsp:Transcript_28108/g.26962  ORF Transcript_28108/g.26962 Transcript_28108/m.26962 type:complete len:636 (+) Transcript_28108:154-2061(+)